MLILADSEDEPILQSAVPRGALDYLLKLRLDGHSLRKPLQRMVERAANDEVLIAKKGLVEMNPLADERAKSTSGNKGLREHRHR